jgi:hypothetical protein
MKMVLEHSGGTVVVLDDGGGVVALGGGVWRWLKIAVAAMGSGSSRRTCNNGISVRVVKAKGLLLQHWHQRW